MLMLLAAEYLMQSTYKLDDNNVPITSDDGRPTRAKAVNGASIPIIATAGMRMQSKQDNEKVWSFICKDPGLDGESENKLPEWIGDFAEGGSSCGTIGGTTEAYYEFLANVISGKSSVQTGTFTIGGQSAQIAIPFTNTAEDKKAQANFFKLQEEVRRDVFWHCQNVRMPSKDGSTDLEGYMHMQAGSSVGLEIADLWGTIPIPSFLANESTNECYKDFINYIHVSQMPRELVRELFNKGLAGVQGVGFISFLAGLTYRDMSPDMPRLAFARKVESIAGGVDAIARWSTRKGADGEPVNVCDTTSTELFNVFECYSKLTAALQQDAMFRAVRAYFTENTFETKRFSYNTPVAIPSKAIYWDNLQPQEIGGETPTASRLAKQKVAVLLASDVDAQEFTHDTEVGTTFLEEIFAVCSGRGKQLSFGHKNRNTCVKALWTSLYISDFFGNERHREDQLYYKVLEWPVGARAALSPRQSP